MAFSLFSSGRKFSSSAVRKVAQVEQKFRCQAYPAYLKELEHAEHSDAGRKKWKIVSAFIALPILLITNVHLFLEHVNHPHGRPEFLEYEYLRIKNKRYPWGDGNKTVFFNPKVNALPTGFED